MGFNKWWIFHFVVPVCSAVFLPSQCEIHYWGNLRQIQVAMENPPLSSTSVPLKCLFSSGISAASNGTDDAKEGMKTNVRFISHYIIEGSLEVKLPTIWTDEKQSREEAERRERLEERRVRRKKMQMREKVGKSRNTVFFQWFGAPEGRKVGSLKRRVRSQLARWEMKNCTPLWHKAHLQVKMYKTPGARSTFGSWDIENAHAVVVQSISKSKCTKHTILGPLLEVQMSKKCTPLWREAHFPSQNVQNTPCTDHFWRFRAGTLSKVTKTWGFCSISKNDGRHGTFEEDLQRCIFVAGAVQKTCSWEMLGGQGAHFLRGVAFWSIRCAGLLRWFCVTGAALRMTWHQFSVAGAVL